MNYEYIAVKIKALPHWLWFATAKVTEVEGRFVGREGWGPGGNAVNADVPSDTLEGRIESDVLMHDDV